MPHKLDIDTLITPALLRRLEAESQFDNKGVSTPFWAVLEKNVAADYITHAVGGLDPLGPQQMMAFDLVTALNRAQHHDGAWVAMWSHPAPRPHVLVREDEYTRLCLMWMDQDGDVQFTLECEGTLEERLMKGILHWQECAEKAWDTWFLHMRVILDPQEGETFKRAKGQNAPSSALNH